MFLVIAMATLYATMEFLPECLGGQGDGNMGGGEED